MPSIPSEQPAALDGLISRYLNRPLSRPLARLAAHTPLSPNQVTIVSALLALLAGALLMGGHNIWAAVGIHASSVVDGADGDLARLTGRNSSFGAIFDAVLDRYADAAIIGGMAWWAYQHEHLPAALALGLVALTGAFVISYTRARAEATTGESPTSGPSGLASRDVRLFVAALGCLLGFVYGALAVIAVAANLVVGLRLVHLYRGLKGK